MIPHAPHVMTLANSIIGVSVLAMPFCFKQCGIILAIVMLSLCSLLSRLSCHFLIKSAVMSRRRNFEYLAFHAFGQMGKFFVELFIIGFLLGTCIAFFVVIGDLGPQIIGKLLNKKPEDIRLSLIVITAIFIILPLGMLKNIDSLAIVCTATIGFYFCLVLKVVNDSMEHIFQLDWTININYWRLAGLLQCLPIFSMALFCQTQLFEIYESIPNVSLEKMNSVVRGALNICTFVYLFVGFFGYVAYCNQPFSGNILSSFEPSMTSDAMKIGFVLSVIFSFPLVIFPCRASLNSLLFHQAHSHELSSNYIPELRFRCLTIIIVGVSMVTGMLMPNIEFVLGFVGSTIGVSICVICPAAFFIAISTKNTNERLLAQVLLFIGIWIMILGTYANLYAMDDSSTTKIIIPTEKPLIQMNNVQFNIKNNDNNQLIIPKVPEVLVNNIDLTKLNLNNDLIKKPEVIETLHDPPVPEKIVAITKKSAELVVPSVSAEIINKPEKNVKKSDENVKKSDENVKKSDENVVKIPETIEVLNAEEKIKAIEESMNQEPLKVDHEEIAVKDQEKVKSDDEKNIDSESKENIRLTLERNKIETKKLIEEQKEILLEQKEFLEDLKEQKKAMDMDKKEKSLVNKENIEEKKLENDNNQKEKKTVVQENKTEIDKKEEEVIHQENKKEKIQEKIVEAIPIEVKKDKLNNDVNIKEKNLNSNNEFEDKNISKLKNKVNNSRNETPEHHDHILKALTSKNIKTIPPKVKENNIPSNENPIDTKINSINIIDKLEEKNSSMHILYPLPLALKLINETKHKESLKTENDNNNVNKKKEENKQDEDSMNNSEKKSMNQRDILETHDREKRDVDEESDNSNNNQPKENDMEIIKTNNYLADPSTKLDDKIFLNKNSLNYEILKTRDLKALKPEKNQD